MWKSVNAARAAAARKKKSTPRKPRRKLVVDAPHSELNVAVVGLHPMARERKVWTMGTADMVRCDRTGQCLCLNGVRQGNTVEQRVGDQIRIREVNLRVFVYPPLEHINLSGLEPYSKPYVCRIMLVVDKQANASQLTLDDVVTGVSVPPYVCGFVRPEQRMRFAVLYDKTYPLESWINYGGSGNMYAAITIGPKPPAMLKEIKVETDLYSQFSGAVAPPLSDGHEMLISGSMWLIVSVNCNTAADSPSISDQHAPQLGFLSQVRFDDM